MQMQRAVQRVLCQFPFTSNVNSPMYGESQLLKSMIQLPSDIASYYDNEYYDYFFEHINRNSWKTRRLPTPPYIGFRHNGAEKDDFTIYFQRYGEGLTEAVLSADDDWKPYRCDCDDDCDDDCPAKRWVITEYKERQLSSLDIFNMLAQNPVFLDVLTYNWPMNRIIPTLIQFGQELGMTFFNPLTMLDTSQYYDQRVCIVCHNPVQPIKVKASKHRMYQLVRCENKYCISVGKEYCNYLKTSIAETCTSFPIDIVRIVMRYYTSIDNRRISGDDEVVGDECFTMARFIIVNMEML
jgi:hypothetical protein